MSGAPASDLGLITRTDWFGDPYLTTNPPGNTQSPFRVSLVLNPLLTTNPDYQAKVSALATTKITDPLAEPLTQLFRSAGAAQLELVKPAMPIGATAAANRRQVPAAPDGYQDGASPQYLIQRWAMFVLVVAFMARRVWRYFYEQEEDDDFADRLATLAVAHRWIFPVYMGLLAVVAGTEFFQAGNLFFSLSLLFLAASLRRYYCEGHFADAPAAQKVHLTLRCGLIWLGWTQGYDSYLNDLAAWCHWHVFAWILLALATTVFSQFYNQQDFAAHRGTLYWFGLGFLFFGIAGATGGYYFWRTRLGNDTAFWWCLGSGVFLAWSPLLVYFRMWSKKVSEQVAGRMLFDMIFSEAAFAEKTRRKKRLPEILLLRHWRDHGEVEKAWQTAQSHLLKETRALPVWLFAMETAVLHRRKPEDALRILGRLGAAEEFSHDHRTVAVVKVQGWMAAAGFPFDATRFKIERPPLQPTALTNKVEQKCREGRFGEAAMMLREVLEKDSLHEPAFTQLVRLYAQDLKNRPAAEKLIAEADETFSPKLLDFLRRSLDEWMQAPIRSTNKPKRFLSWLRGEKAADAGPKKIFINSPPMGQSAPKPESADPLERYLGRVKESRGTPPDTTLVEDKMEKLLLERRLGTAVELIKQQAEAQPENFDLWLRYAEAHGHHCADLHSAEKIIRRMERSGHFKKAQLKKAHTRLKKWHKKHAGIRSGW